jgi:hypothetical protein
LVDHERRPFRAAFSYVGREPRIQTEKFAVAKSACGTALFEFHTKYESGSAGRASSALYPMPWQRPATVRME